MIEEYVTIYGYWKDSKEPIERLCKVDSRANPNHWAHQQFLYDLDEEDDSVFYYFEPDEHILGDKGDFYVTKYTVEGELV